MIPKSDLEHGAYYAGRCRNASIARWNADNERFYHWRHKFGWNYVETIRHYDDKTLFDVFRPTHKLDTVETPIPMDD